MINSVVLVPVYANQDGLDRSLESLRKVPGPFQLVIVDDGSPIPISVPSDLGRQRRISLLRYEQNQGIAAALNHGLRYILERDYTYIARLDAGDVVSPERLERQASFLDANPDCGAVSSFVDFVDHTEVPLFRYRAPCTHHEILKRLRLGNCLVHSGVMIRSRILREVGLYREDVPYAEDYELFLRMSSRCTLAVLPDVLTRCEYSASGLSVKGRQRHQRERLRLQVKHFDPASPYSFYGVGRSLFGMITPHWAVLRFKQMFFR